MRRRLTIRVLDPEHPLFENNWFSIQGGAARSVIAGLFPNGPSVSVAGGLYAEAYCPAESRRWRFYEGKSEPEVGEIRARWG